MAIEAEGMRRLAEFGGLCRDTLGPTVIWIDSSAARSLAIRSGTGRTRHLSARCLWIQAHVAERRLCVRHVRGAANPADIGTKLFTQVALESLLRMLVYAAVGEADNVGA